MKKAIIYTRSATRTLTNRDDDPLMIQIRNLRKYAAKRGYKAEKVYSIRGSGSSKRNRSVLLSMLKYASTHGINIILCEKGDRLTRNIRDAIMIDEWVREHPDREVHFVADSLVLSTRSKKRERLLWDMRMLIARHYTDSISERIKRGQHKV